MHWPTFPDFAAAAALPDGVTLRAWTPAELDALPARLVEWYPAITVGAESAFLDARFLHTQVATAEAPERDLFAFAICRDDVVVGFQAFQRDRGARALYGRLGVLAPEARSGFLGALGFGLFETLGRLLSAELLLVWVTLASKGQQLFAERRGFILCGLVPGFDRDLQGDGRVLRVSEALYAKPLLGPVSSLWPDEATLTSKTREVLAVLRAVSRS